MVVNGLRKDDISFRKAVEKLPESPSTSGSINTAENVTSRCDLDSVHEERLNFLHDLHESQGITTEKSLKIVNGRLKGYFYSKTVFNLSRKVLKEAEIRVAEKGLALAPTPTRINESELKRHFNENFSKNGIFEMTPQRTFQRNQLLILNVTGIHLTITLH